MPSRIRRNQAESSRANESQLSKTISAESNNVKKSQKESFRQAQAETESAKSSRVSRIESNRPYMLYSRIRPTYLESNRDNIGHSHILKFILIHFLSHFLSPS